MAVILALLAAEATATTAQSTPVPPGRISIHNGFASKLFVQCDSDIAHEPADLVWPQEAHRIDFWPDAHRFWMCTVKTTPHDEYPYTPVVPRLGGRFTLYVRAEAFRACYLICAWKVDGDGLWLILEAGEDPTKIYNWPPLP